MDKVLLQVSWPVQQQDEDEESDPTMGTLQAIGRGELSVNHSHFEELIKRGLIRFSQPWTVEVTPVGRSILKRLNKGLN